MGALGANPGPLFLWHENRPQPWITGGEAKLDRSLASWFRAAGRGQDQQWLGYTCERITGFALNLRINGEEGFESLPVRRA